MNPKRVVSIGLSLVVISVVLVLFLFVQTREGDEGSLPKASGPEPTAELKPEPGPPAAKVAAEPAPEAKAQELGNVAPSARARAVNRKDRALMLAAILAKINRAQAQDAKEGQVPEKESDPVEATGSLPKEYIKQQVGEIVPLIKECYEMALEKQSDLSGDMKVRFTIVADEEYGGLVEESEILKGSSLIDSGDMVECVRETMYAIELKKPEGGGRIVVTYPFIFNSSR